MLILYNSVSIETTKKLGVYSTNTNEITLLINVPTHKVSQSWALGQTLKCINITVFGDEERSFLADEFARE